MSINIIHNISNRRNKKNMFPNVVPIFYVSFFMCCFFLCFVVVLVFGTMFIHISGVYKHILLSAFHVAISWPFH